MVPDASESFTVGRDGRGWWSRSYVRCADMAEPARPWHRLRAETREEAEAEAAELLAADADAAVRGSSAPAVDMLLRYVADRQAYGLIKPATAEAYRGAVERYVRPVLGRRPVRDVSTRTVQALYTRLIRRGLAPSTVVQVHSLLSEAFADFAAKGAVERSPVEGVTVPSRAGAEAACLTREQAASVVAWAEAACTEPGGGWTRKAAMERVTATAAALALASGLRCGEACGLRWLDVDLSKPSVFVRRTASEAGGLHLGPPKSAAGVRDVELPDEWRGRLSDLAAWERDALGLDPSGTAPVLTADGKLLRPSALSRAFSAHREALGLPASCTFHTLRHTHASLLLSEGVGVNRVSKRLGHASPATTLRIYAHVMPGDDSASADAIGAALGRGK